MGPALGEDLRGLPDAPRTEAYQEEVTARLAATIACLHPIFVDLRSAVAERFRYFREVRP